MRILVVEDAAPVSDLLVDLLTADGYDVRVAPDGASALAMLDTVRPDAILCDFQLPGGDAAGVYDEIERQHPALRAHFLLMAGDAEDDAVRGFVERTGVPYLPKPFAIEAALGALRALLGTRALRREPRGPRSARRPLADGAGRASLDLLTDALGELLLEDTLDDGDLRAAAETLLPTLYDALRDAGYGRAP